MDGPWKLSAFNSDGHVTFVPNTSCSGPVKPKLSAFEELPFTTDAAEYNVLRSPSSVSKIDVGYLPNQDAPPVRPGQTVGANPLSGYTLAPVYPWGISLCGPGIAKGTALTFNFLYESGVQWVQSEMVQLQSNAAQVGIRLNLVPKPFAQVISVAEGDCVVTKVPCNTPETWYFVK